MRLKERGECNPMIDDTHPKGPSRVAQLWVASVLLPSAFLSLFKILRGDFCLFFRSYFNYNISPLPFTPFKPFFMPSPALLKIHGSPSPHLCIHLYS